MRSSSNDLRHSSNITSENAPENSIASMKPPIRPPILRIANGTFYRHHPSSTSTSSSSRPNPSLFNDLSFELSSSSATDTDSPKKHWCVVGPSLSGKTTFLQLLRGQHLCTPPTARSYPYLSTDHVPARLRIPSQAIQYVGFDGEQQQGLAGPATSAYLSARYESRREDTDFSLRDFLLGNTELNPLKPEPGGAKEQGRDERDTNTALQSRLDRVVADLRLAPQLDLPVAFLSNGQGRRARIARALLRAPEVLLLDEPFMGLDPPTVAALSPLLRGMAERAAPRLVLSARPQDPIPEWITHVAYLRSDCQVGSMGQKRDVTEGLRMYVRGVGRGTLKEDETLPVHTLAELGRTLTEKGIEGQGLAGMESVAAANQGVGVGSTTENVDTETDDGPVPSSAEPLVEMDGCQVRYGDKIALGDWAQQTTESGQQGHKQHKHGLVWTVRRGERWGVFGPNGSGKTTVVSLLCSDHPQSYSLPIKLFGRSRIPEPGSGARPLTFWDIQERIGHSSPEVHQHMPPSLSIRQVLENAWAGTFKSVPRLDEEARGKVEAALGWFAGELDPGSTAVHAHGGDGRGEGVRDLAWADDNLFGRLSFSTQRVALFLRAVIKKPDIIVLDEAFSGMDEAVRDKCMTFLIKGDGGNMITGLSKEQALVCISHVKEEVPDCVREWMCLPETNGGGAPARSGRLDGPLRRDEKRWREVWGL